MFTAVKGSQFYFFFQITFNAILCLYCKNNSCCRLQVIYVTLYKTRPVVKQEVFSKKKYKLRQSCRTNVNIIACVDVILMYRPDVIIVAS